MEAVWLKLHQIIVMKDYDCLLLETKHLSFKLVSLRKDTVPFPVFASNYTYQPTPWECLL